MPKSSRVLSTCVILWLVCTAIPAQVVDVGGHPQAEYLQKLLQEKGGVAGLDRWLDGIPELKTSLVNMTGVMGNSRGTDWKVTEFLVATMPGTRGDSLTIAFNGIRASATLYEHFGFSGKRADIELRQREANMKQSRFENIRDLNEAVSSARVAGAGALKVYVRPNFAGSSETLLEDSRAFAREMNDKVSSFCLEPRILRKKFSPLDDVVGLFQQYGPMVSIQAPRAGAVWNAGGVYTVRWTSRRFAGTLQISLSRRGSAMQMIMPIVTRAVNASAGSTMLEVPDNAESGSYLLRITFKGGVADPVSIVIR